MRWCLLGPLRLLAAGREIGLGPGKQRCLMVSLLLTPRRPVAVDTLIDRVWGDSPPRSRQALAPYATRLRRILDPVAGAGTLRHVAGGYLIDCDPDLVDLHRARRLVSEARAAGDDGRVDDLLTEALSGWQPEALAGVPGAWAGRVREALAGERLDLVAERAQVRLRLGRAAEVVRELGPLTAEQPTAELVVAALMSALARSGSPARALECYSRARAAIADQLGTEPSAGLRELHLRILRGEHVAGPAVAPAQLPAVVAGFTGRRPELSLLDGLLPAATGALAIGAVTGAPGVGKTALAVHWGHRVAGRFPDGQLYLNLRGFDRTGSVMSAEDALTALLAAVAPAHEIPAGLDARAALLRTQLAGRRFLLLLDNARDAAQVRPLLPGRFSGVVVVTSRDELTGLVAGHGARPVPLEPLDAADALELLAGRLGRPRVEAEPRPVTALVTATGGLPLALVTVAARAAMRPGQPLADVAAELARADRRLDGMSSGDAATDVRTVFSWSYRALRPAAARLFRLLGAHPGPDIGRAALASLAGLPEHELHEPLAELIAAHLVTEHRPARYLSHDLLRAYAAELAGAAEAREAAGRVLDHYLHTGIEAAMLLDPQREPIRPAAPRSGVTPQRLGDESAALAWFGAEHATLMAAVRFAARPGWEAYGWQLPWTLGDFLDRRGHWDDWIVSGRIAVEAAGRAADRGAEATAQRVLGRGYVQVGRYRDAELHYARALALFAELGDAAGQGHTRFSMSWLAEREGRYEDCVTHSRRALALYRAAGHRVGIARALNALGWDLGRLGRYRDTLRYCREALELQRQLGDRYGEAAAWDSIGWARHHLGHHEQALHGYRRALALYRETGDLLNEAEILDHIGETYAATGDAGEAAAAWRRAEAILDDLQHPDVATVRAKLARRLPDRSVSTRICGHAQHIDID